jgi:hypothetical protein
MTGTRRRTLVLFLLEYAFSTADCGKPCPAEPILPNELMTLGGDVVDAKLPKTELNPKAPEPTEEEKAAFEAQTRDQGRQRKGRFQKRVAAGPRRTGGS